MADATAVIKKMSEQIGQLSVDLAIVRAEYDELLEKYKNTADIEVVSE